MLLLLLLLLLGVVGGCTTGYLEEWLASICERAVTSTGPSLWRDAALSFYFQLIKSVKSHLYCTDVEDALVLKVKEESQQLEEETEADVRAACYRARRSSLAGLCARSLRYALCIGESLTPGNTHMQEFLQELQENTRKDVLFLAPEDEEDDDVVGEEQEDVTALGMFSDPMQACSLLAEVTHPCLLY